LVEPRHLRSMKAPSATRAVVIGGGTMGTDVAAVLLRAQCQTCVIEPDITRHPAIVERVQASLGDLGCAENKRLLKLVRELEEVDWNNIDLAIECIPEQLDLKRKLFGELVNTASATTILASNSSSYPISQIATGLNTQHRMIGLHFFMPAHIVPLVEVVLGPQTDLAMAESL